MFNVLNYSQIKPYGYCMSIIGGEDSMINSPLYQWLLAGKIYESPIIEPTNRTQVIAPSGANRALRQITVRGKIPATYQITIAVGGTASIGLDGVITATPETTATATATVANGIVTVSGVAAGITAIRLYNANDALIGIIIATIKAA